MELHTQRMLGTILPCTRYHDDMLYDAMRILQRQLRYFQGLDPAEERRTRESIAQLAPYAHHPSACLRLYILCGLRGFVFAGIDLDPEDADDLCDLLREQEFSHGRLPGKKLDPRLICSLFVFDGVDIAAEFHIYPEIMLAILEQFRPRNLIRQRRAC